MTQTPTLTARLMSGQFAELLEIVAQVFPGLF